MCILCVLQKWSRRVGTMLPWLVIPMIGLWMLSQLLPPAFCFEITCTRLTCVFVLLMTLCWYEVLMPQLSFWRMRRSALMREKKRSEAIEMQKLRKTATRRCRNCLTPYRDQNPGGGKFMCSYCGHVSKRPVLDLPVPQGLSNAGILKHLVGKGAKLLNGKVWSDIYAQDWLENGNMVRGTLGGLPSNLHKNGSELYSRKETCMTVGSHSCFAVFWRKIFMVFLTSIGLVWRRMAQSSSNGVNSSLGEDHNGMLTKQGDNMGNYNENRSEKARRKAEEKRQARVERELLEEEERKQREEVSRLVEERRKLKDEIAGAEKDHCGSVSASREKDHGKESENKQQDRREKDKGSSKSNSDVEGLEKGAGKESVRKRELDRKSEIHRKSNFRTTTDTANNQSLDMLHSLDRTHGNKSSVTRSYSHGNSGTRYLDRVKGSFLSSSKAISGSSLFGRGGTSSVVFKENKPNASADPFHHSANMRDFSKFVKSSMKEKDKVISRPVFSEPQLTMAPKKTWGQLFTRSPDVPPVTNSNVIGRPYAKSQVDIRKPPLMGHPSSDQVYDNPTNNGVSLPFSLPTFSYSPTSSCTVPQLTSEAMFPCIGEMHRDFLPEEYEIFEDPCYVPDPMSLLGPVSESLDNFQLDLGAGFATNIGLEMSGALKSISTAEINGKSPIDSPISRTHILDEKHFNLNRLPTMPKGQDIHTLPMDNSYDANQNGTWQMWNSSPLGQDGLGLIGGGPASWVLPPELNRLNKDEVVLPMAQKTAASLFSADNQAFSCTHSPMKVFPGSGHDVGNFASIPGSTGDSWLRTTLFAHIPGTDGCFSSNLFEDNCQNEKMNGSPSSSASNHSFDFYPANVWAKNDRVSCADGSSLSTKPHHVGGLYSTPDVQSLWSYD